MIRATRIALALAAALAARGSAAAAPRDHVLAFEHTHAGIFLERLDARTLRPLPDKPKHVLVARRLPIDWDLSPARSRLIVASNKARIVDLATFKVQTRCCLPFPVASPDYVSLLWTTEGVEVIDDGGNTWDLGGGGFTLNAPYGLADFAKGPTGLVKLYTHQVPGGSLVWSVSRTSAGEPLDVPELNGEPKVALAVDGNRIYLMTPAGKLVTVGTSDTSRSVPLPPTRPVYDFRITTWTPGLLIASTSSQLVLVDSQQGTAQPLRLDATDFSPGASDLVVWNRRTRDGLFVYDRSGNERFHLLPSTTIGCVALHNRLAYVAVSNGGGCSRMRSIFDLRTGQVIGHASAPTELIG